MNNKKLDTLCINTLRFFRRSEGIEAIGVDRFGASAPGKVVMDEYGFNAENIYVRSLEILRDRKQRHDESRYSSRSMEDWN